MTVEYQPTIEDVFRLKTALHRRARRHPLLWMVIAGGCAIAAGGVMMASVASPLWYALTLAGAAFAATGCLAACMNAPTLAKVEQDHAAHAWLRDPFRVEVGPDGLAYEHGPYRTRAAWSAVRTLVETDHHLIVVERRAPGMLAYGLPKRELEKTPGGAAAWRAFIRQQLRR